MNLIKQLQKLAEKCKADRFDIEPTPDNLLQRIKLEAIEEAVSGLITALPELEKKAKEKGFDEEKNKKAYAVRRAYAQWILSNHNDRRFSVNDWTLYSDIRDAYILAEESALAEVPQ